MKINIIPFEERYWQAVSEIYGLGLLTRNATFETEVPDFKVWTKKFIPDLLWIALHEQVVVAWAGLMPVSVRKAYEGVAEVSIYVHPKYAGKGVGKSLMLHLIEESEKHGIWTLFASIFPENTASSKLHVATGFRYIGYREKVAKLDGIWRDTALYERRSKLSGV